MFSTLLRILKHRWLDLSDARKAVPPALSARLAQRVTASEARHTDEVRICVEAGLPLSYLWRRASPRERAVNLFGKLRVWDTPHNNGVLIYLLLAEHAIEIVADRGIHTVVPADFWPSVISHLRSKLQTGDYEGGITDALEEVSAVLVAHFPLAAGSVRENALPNTPILV